MANPNTNVTAVPQPTFGPQGFVAPPESLILNGVLTDIQAAFAAGGFNLNITNLFTPQGQLASSETAIIGDANAMFLWFTNQVDPAYSSGRMQDAIGRIYFITRIPGSPTVQPCICNGLANTIIPVGSLAVDPTNAIWVCQQQGTIAASGNVTLNFAAANQGPTPAPASLVISQAVFGWDSITPTGPAALGTNVETRQQFEIRRSQSTAINSTGQLPAILGAVLQVPGVLDAYVTENDLGSPATVGGVLLNPNSVYVCVLGGASQAVAQAIWSRKAPGCSYTGNFFTTVVDPSPTYSPPVPSYLVGFETPTIVPFAALVTITNNLAIPSNAATQVQNAIVAAFAGLDGGSRARIGSIVYSSRYYGNVISLGAWAQVVQIQLGVSGSAASIQGSIANTALTVGSLVSGTITVGQLLQGTGLISGSGAVILSQTSGTVGGVGVYQISVNEGIVVSQPMTLTNLFNDVVMNINQAPTISVGNIYVSLM